MASGTPGEDEMVPYPWSRDLNEIMVSRMSEIVTSPSQELIAVQAELASLQTQLDEARDEAELNLLMLQQVQEELEFYFLAHQEQDQQLQQHREAMARAQALIEALLERLEQQR
jgi:hypothetical protein